MLEHHEKKIRASEPSAVSLSSPVGQAYDSRALKNPLSEEMKSAAIGGATGRRPLCVITKKTKVKEKRNETGAMRRMTTGMAALDAVSLQYLWRNYGSLVK